MNIVTRLALPDTGDALYWKVVRLRALGLKSNGCSGPAQWTQWYKDACYEHDIHYKTGKALNGRDISRLHADDLLATRIRQMAWAALHWHPRTWKHLGGFAVAGWRWVAVRLGGWWSYQGTAMVLILLAGCSAPVPLLPTTPSMSCDFRMVDHNRRACLQHGGTFLEPTETRLCGFCGRPQ